METSVPSSARPDAHLPESMEAWEVSGHFGASDRLRLVERAVPVPAPGEVLLRVRAPVGSAAPTCTAPTATCRRTGSRGRARPRGRRRGGGARRRRAAVHVGDRVGIAWLRRTCGTAAGAVGRREPLPVLHATPAGTPTAGSPSTPSCQRRSPTGSRPRSSDLDAAPLLCAGIIGYRALRRAQLPPGRPARDLRLRGQRPPHRADRHRPGGGGARPDPGAAARGLALELGAASAGGAYDEPRCRWTRRSLSPRRATWCRWRWPPWTAVAPSPSRASTSATSRSWTTSGTCSGSAP